MSDKTGPGPAPPRAAALPLEDIRRAVESVRFGVVQLVIQDGRIVQIDKTEKIRIA